MIQFPNLDINIDEGLDNKEILQQILDAIHKQRKELNFYLMNLNEDNMPTIAGRMEDIEGNISLIDQNIDEILLLVANNAGDIAALSVRADQIQAQVSNNAGDIAALSMRADQIQAQVADNAGNISQLSIRADEIETVVVDNHEYVTTQLGLLGDEIVEVETTLSNQISTVSQTASQIQTQVSNLVTEVSNLGTTVTQNYSTLTQRADSIESTVSRISRSVDGLEDDMDWAYSEIRQLANEITAKVTIGDVVNYLSINRSGVQIHAGNIDLTGITRIYDPYDSSNYARINGSTFELFRRGSVFFNISYGSWGTELWSDNYNLDIYSGIDVRGESAFESYVDFYNDVGFYGDVDFSRANVYGLDTDIDTRYLIECYYASNKCYLDLSSAGTYIIVRDRYGGTVGRIYIE